MRKGLAIFFLSIILLNIAGYYLVFEGWRYHHAASWSFDENAGDAQEMIIEIPVNVPYAEEKDWQSADGQFEYKGDVYRIVKQKLTLEAVYLACVKDAENTRINQQLDEFAKTFGDKPADAKSGGKSLPAFIKEYISPSISIKHSISGWFIEVTYNLAPSTLAPSYFASIVHPPERA
jgi:hypothetical protein